MVIKRTTKLRWRRRFRSSKQQVEGISTQADEHLERHFFRRLARLAEVRRFIAAWVMLVILLIAGLVLQVRALGDHYLSLQPVPGGTFTEGILGSFTNANPLYASEGVDSAVSRLVFSGLFKYNQKNQLVGDLAESLSVDERGTRYAVKLRPNLSWHDGAPLTAQDVVFTYRAIQNPDAKSPFESSYRGISVAAESSSTIIFILPNALSSFPHSLTNGIVPKHLLDGIPMPQMRSISFNTQNPIGSGPFKWKAVEVHGDKPENREQRVGLAANSAYHGGAPKLDQFIVRAFRGQEQLVKSLDNNELSGAAGLDALPEELQKDITLQSHNIPLTSEVMVFFKGSHPILSDVQVRRALVQATSTADIISGLGYPVITANAPLLKNDIGYDKNLTQLAYNLDAAKQALDQSGWTTGSDGMRSKDGQPLTFTLYSQNTSEYTYASQIIQKAWQKLGVNLEVVLQPKSDLQSTIINQDYDALLYGIELGPDPDVFAYWHSSQSDIRSTHLNLSQYKSTVADQALEGGRTRADPGVRAAKYRPFLEVWRSDAPAIALYQPRFLYVTDGPLFGFDMHSMNSAPDRYANVENWMIRQDRVIAE